MKKLFIASDHAAFDLKKSLVENKNLGVEWVDLGTGSTDSVQYPDYAQDLCRKILKETSQEALLSPCGVLLCGSGVGMSMSANRFKGIRAALAESVEVAELSRQHNASNVLCMGARIVDEATALNIFRKWLATPFEGGRHLTRIKLMDS